MRVLLLGADTPIGFSLRAFIPPLRRHELVPVNLLDVCTKRERQIKKLVKVANPDLIVDARLISLLGEPDQIDEGTVERTRQLADVCRKLDAKYFLLSSSRVFTGNLRRPYSESDPADAVDQVGRVLVETESVLTQTLESVFTLRLGWMFSGRGPCQFKDVLDRLRAGKVVNATDRRRDCPVHTAEVARVVAGVIDQISVGAPARGVYHYGSAGDTGWFAFCEAMVAHASQYDVFSDATDLLQEEPNAELIDVNRSLECTAIRHQFGIQRRPWRDFVERAVRRYIEIYCEDPQ